MSKYLPGFSFVPSKQALESSHMWGEQPFLDHTSIESLRDFNTGLEAAAGSSVTGHSLLSQRSTFDHKSLFDRPS